MTDFDNLRRDVRRKLNLDPIYAVIGDQSGNIDDTLNPGSGLWWVRMMTSNGLSTPMLVRGPTAANVVKAPGRNVLLKYDEKEELYIAGADFDGERQAGNNPTQAATNSNSTLIGQQALLTARVICTSPTSLSVRILNWPIDSSNTFYLFPAQDVDLTSFVPSAGNHRFAMIFIKNDYATTEVKASTAKSMLDPMDSTDTQECLTAKTAGSTPIWCVYLHDAQTAVTDSDLNTDGFDFRQMINTSDPVLQHIAPSTYKTLQDMQNVVHSAGWVAGGAVTDNGDGTVAVAAGSGLIHPTDSATATLYFFDWSADTSISLTNNDDNWIYVDYNAGAPIAVASTTSPVGDRTKVILAYIYRTGTELHINQSWRWTVGDHANLMMWEMAEVMPFARVSGGMISGSNRDILLTSGVWWHGLTRFTTNSFDSSGADTFNAYYRDGGGGWTEVTALSEVNNTQYDDNSGTLATLTANRYGVHWVYLATDDDVHVVFGRGDYTLTLAQEAQPPADLPPELVVDSTFVGKIIIQKSAASFTSVESPFTIPFVVSGGGGTGDVIGPGSAVDNDIALFDGTSGKTIKDSGVTVVQLQQRAMSYAWFMG